MIRRKSETSEGSGSRQRTRPLSSIEAALTTRPGLLLARVAVGIADPGRVHDVRLAAVDLAGLTVAEGRRVRVYSGLPGPPPSECRPSNPSGRRAASLENRRCDSWS